MLFRSPTFACTRSECEPGLVVGVLWVAQVNRGPFIPDDEAGFEGNKSVGVFQGGRPALLLLLPSLVLPPWAWGGEAAPSALQTLERKTSLVLGSEPDLYRDKHSSEP